MISSLNGHEAPEIRFGPNGERTAKVGALKMDKARRLSEDEMLALLDRAFQNDPEQDLICQLAQKLNDPLRSGDERGRGRIHPLLLAIVALAAITIGSFIFFGIFQR